MISVSINDATHDLYPFPKRLWDNPNVVYHGSWSTYCPRIEAEGFVHVDLPIDHSHISAVVEVGNALGIGSFASDTPEPNPMLSMDGNYWGARCYSTDKGGELVRMVLKDSHILEAICTVEEKRLALKARWENGLKGSPNHAPTLAAVQLLGDHQALLGMAERIREARRGIEAATAGGFPVVYALSVEAQWFPDLWERYTYNRRRGYRGAVELVCRRDLITVDRIVAKAMYPNGTDPNFQPDGFKTWKQLGLLPWTRKAKHAP